MKVLKRDGRKVEFSKEKIVNAILKAMADAEEVNKDVANRIANEISKMECEQLGVEDIQNTVEEKLMSSRLKKTARSYIRYRYKKELIRQGNTTDKTIFELLKGDSEYWNTENSNKDQKVVTTQRDYIAGITSTDIAKRFLLPKEVVEAHEAGIIHQHDLDYMAQNALTNCCLINLEDMLMNGTVINGVQIEPQHRLLTATTVATQIITAVASSQYGGTTISLTHLAPFVRMSYQRYLKEVTEELSQLNNFNSPQEKESVIVQIATKRLQREIKDAVQTFNYQINSMSTTNGQAPFLSVFMYLNENTEYIKEVAMLIEEFLHQRILGMKNEKGVYITQAFPKLLYVLDENNIHEDGEYFYLTELAAKCTAKRMVPDYISAKIMKELKINQYGHGDVYGCMGCVDGNEIITYKFKDKLYVESFVRMWERMSQHYDVKIQPDGINKYIDLNEVKIYDTKQGLVDCQRIIKNKSNKWFDINISGGRRLLVTDDHPFETENRGIVLARDLTTNDTIKINYSQYCEEKYNYNLDLAWLLGFMLCDGCYQNNHIFGSIAAIGEDDIEQKWIDTFKNLFDINTNVILQERGRQGIYKDLCLISDGNGKINKLINLFTSKFKGINKKDRHIPNEVFSWNIEAKYAFLSGMIDADGYLNPTSSGGSVVQLGSTNKELALQQLSLAQALGMSAKLYHNHYSKRNPELIRYRIEFDPNDTLVSHLVCKKKKENYIPRNMERQCLDVQKVSEITEINIVHDSFDVTTESEHFEVSGIYSHNCRSFLTPDRIQGNIARAQNYQEGAGKYYGRFNVGVTTINLVDIALSCGGDFNKFWDLFEERTELCHKGLRARIDRLEKITSDVAPILYQHGAFARLNKGEGIKPLIHGGYATASLGYAGLYECVKYMTGHSHTDNGVGYEFGIKVMQFLNDKCNQWKAEEDIDYSPYGAPIEATTYKFAKLLKERFGIIEGITDHDYITNSYHVCVREEIDAFTKLELESKFQKLSPGGAISYVETSNLTGNIEAVLEVIKFIYNHIMYAELNTKSDYCQECGYDGEILIDENMEWYCPNCGNRDQSKMNVARRTCGYIGSHFWNYGRTEEIKERFVHLGGDD